jgi:hypothetical protein
MKSFFQSSLLFATFYVILTSCSKSNVKTTDSGGTVGKPPDSTVYIAGDNGTNPILWKNGIPDTLSATLGTASQVIVSGNNVYVAGICQVVEIFGSPGVLAAPVTGQYAYWKNGIQNNIGSFGDLTGGSKVSIAVIGNNVYYTNGLAWENGTVIALPGLGYGFVNSTFAIGSDIYFVGTDSAQDAVYWKNGKLNVVSAYKGIGFTRPYAYCIYVSGTDVYVGGMFNQAVYWKNGTPNFLQYPDMISFVSSIGFILVSENDVYTTGKLIGSYSGVPSYWKNGIENDLSLIGSPNIATSYTTTSCFLSGSDVYVTGFSVTQPSSPTMLPTNAPVFWKNDVETVLAPAGYANSVCVH